MLLGSGELGKEITIAAKRLGCKVIACDRYEDAPAMQMADISEVLDMRNSAKLLSTVHKYKPDLVVPEIEALAVNALIELEKEGIKVIPNAKATAITMNRDQIRNLASKTLGLKTAKFAYASNAKDLAEEASQIGWPVIVKPVMSSSGKGQSLVKNPQDIQTAWTTAIEGARGDANLVIVEEFLQFNLEITLLTVRQADGSTIFCEPIGHEQIDGDYQCSWQPAELSKEQLNTAKSMAIEITKNLGGVGLFGVEFFICNKEVIFSELSPRPHDTGLVTLISQNINEFELHLRAILGLPIPEIKCEGYSASRVILSEKTLSNFGYTGIEKALTKANTKLFFFGKPKATQGRRMGVAVANGKSIKEAQDNADYVAQCIKIIDTNI